MKEYTYVMSRPSNVKKNDFPNSIRSLGDINNNLDNLIHASNSTESALKEIINFFNSDIKEN